MEIWRYGQSNSVFSKIHLDIFKHKMQQVFMFQTLLSLTYYDNFFQADFFPNHLR